jgi:dTDP-4-amino-4,6-dideoxygalactose transaminase
LFHTAEGGAMFCNDMVLQHKLFYSHNFGHDGPLDFFGLGINGKISELQAAMGLTVFPYLENIISRRKEIVENYNQLLNNTNIQLLKLREGTTWNYSYYPVIFQNQEKLLDVQLALNKQNIFPRRYFYPSLNKVNFLPAYQPMPVSEAIATKILCLPLYDSLSINEVKLIVEIIKNTL